MKICGIADAENARGAAQGGADALGFVFHKPSVRYIAPAHAGEIIQELPPFVDAVGLVVDLEPEDLDNIARLSGIDYFQFHGNEDPWVCKASGLPFLKALRIKPGMDIQASSDLYTGARGLLLDTFVHDLPGGTGDTFDWSRIPDSLSSPVFLAGGLNVDNVAQAIRTVRPYGVDVSSGVEQSPGVKDPDRIAKFLQSVLDADYHSRHTDS
ncbi:MAG: N-(5'-phosphoribosyl)anthranilate isomerase [Gammaproteobacteria bacterium]|nr:N-(5'-phosphoribosyl)anthranilate isomerase [Gammaproteobacteria bacterium]